MLHTFVLRLLSSELDNDRIVGRVEAAESGRVGAVHDLDELARFLRGEAGAPDHDPGDGQHGHDT